MIRPPVDYIDRTQELYSRLSYPLYSWVKSKSAPPWSPPKKPLSECRLALIGSGGIYLEGQIAFGFRDDISFREINKDVSIRDIRVTHFAYDLTDARRDPNIVFPIEPLRQLEKEGLIGELSQTAYTFMGGIYSSRKVRDLLAPALADRLEADEVDLALLVPV